MEASLKEHCLDLSNFWFKSMTCKHHAPYLNMLTTALYLMFAITLVCLCYRRNDMHTNARKTKEMIICFCRNDNHVASIPRIVLDDNDIERFTQAKVLGVTLSSDLSWNAHVDMIVSKARNRVFTIHQLKRAGIRQCDLLRVYVSVIRPVLEYACPV